MRFQEDLLFVKHLKDFFMEIRYVSNQRRIRPLEELRKNYTDFLVKKVRIW
jgi:hypothetical protein